MLGQMFQCLNNLIVYGKDILPKSVDSINIVMEDIGFLFFIYLRVGRFKKLKTNCPLFYKNILDYFIVAEQSYDPEREMLGG